jgi:hypothetical protein
MWYIKKIVFIFILVQPSPTSKCAQAKIALSEEAPIVFTRAQALFKQVATKQDMHTITGNNPLIKAILEHDRAAFDAAITTENIHHANAKGQTALHILAYSTALKSTGSEKKAPFTVYATETLLAHGADPFKTDHDNQSAFSIMHGLAQYQKATPLAEKMLELIFFVTFFKSTCEQ